MREQQPEALRLVNSRQNAHLVSWQANACAELRRLSNVNYELMEALRWIADRCPSHLMDQPLHNIHQEMAFDAGSCARYAITETEKQTYA